MAVQQTRGTSVWCNGDAASLPPPLLWGSKILQNGACDVDHMSEGYGVEVAECKQSGKAGAVPSLPQLTPAAVQP